MCYFDTRIGLQHASVLFRYTYRPQTMDIKETERENNLKMYCIYLKYAHFFLKSKVFF